MFEGEACAAVHAKFCGDDVTVPIQAVDLARVGFAAACGRHVVVGAHHEVIIEGHIQPIEFTGEIIAFDEEDVIRIHSRMACAARR